MKSKILLILTGIFLSTYSLAESCRDLGLNEDSFKTCMSITKSGLTSVYGLTHDGVLHRKRDIGGTCIVSERVEKIKKSVSTDKACNLYFTSNDESFTWSGYKDVKNFGCEKINKNIDTDNCNLVTAIKREIDVVKFSVIDNVEYYANIFGQIGKGYVTSMSLGRNGILILQNNVGWSIGKYGDIKDYTLNRCYSEASSSANKYFAFALRTDNRVLAVRYSPDSDSSHVSDEDITNETYVSLKHYMQKNSICGGQTAE